MKSTQCHPTPLTCVSGCVYIDYCRELRKRGWGEKVFLVHRAGLFTLHSRGKGERKRGGGIEFTPGLDHIRHDSYCISYAIWVGDSHFTRVCFFSLQRSRDIQ